MTVDTCWSERKNREGRGGEVGGGGIRGAWVSNTVYLCVRACAPVDSPQTSHMYIIFHISSNREREIARKNQQKKKGEIFPRGKSSLGILRAILCTSDAHIVMARKPPNRAEDTLSGRERNSLLERSREK